MRAALIFAALSVAPTFSAHAKVKILSYGSMQGKGSLGELIQQKAAALCAECAVEFVSTDQVSGLVGRLRKDSKRLKEFPYDMVIGLDRPQYQTLLAEKKIAPGAMLDSAPFSLIVDTQKFPKDKWPKSWKTLLPALEGKILVQDPRVSSVGLGWLRVIYDMKVLDAAQAKKLTARVFPSWSSAYSAFLKGEGAAIWSYSTSEAYHRCQEKSERYLALPLEEGYPVQEEWAAPLAGREKTPHVLKVMELLMSSDFQKEIPSRQWMRPGLAGTPVPECFAKTTDVKSWAPVKEPTLQEIIQWSDRWSL